MQPQDIPSSVSCPDCGADPTHESVVRHHLSDMGYVHDDVQLECQDCDNGWVLGIPIGEFNGGDDLHCDCCNDSWMFVHRVQLKELSGGRRKYRIHLKCPNCFYFTETHRDSDENGLALIGYPPITGNTDEAEEYGYPEGRTNGEAEATDDLPADCGRDDCIIHGHGTVGCPNTN